MRALIAAPFYPPHPGGIERYSGGVAAELCRRGWDVHVLHCIADDESPSPSGPSGERLHPLRARKVAGRLPFPHVSRHNADVLREVRAMSFDFTLIQSHLFVSNLLAVRTATRERAVWLNHGSGHVPTGNPVTDRMVAAYEHLLAARLRTQVGAAGGVSEEAAAWLSHLRVHTDASVGNAVAEVAPPRTGRRDGPLRVVYVGRLESGKGALDAVRLVDGLPASTEIELTVVGSGTLLAQVEREARASTKPVVTTGAVPHEQVRAHVADADVFLYPSTYPEGFPTVLLEAGAAGCAVITYGVAGTRELLENGGGWRVSGSEDAAARLQTLADRPSDATAAGEALRRTIRTTYTWTSVVDRLLRLGGVSA
jgi:glycosyltransferase involved in cell wall biosynthesis